MANWTVTLNDLDPERLAITHMFQIVLEFEPRENPTRSGGSFSFDVPGQHWAKILQTALEAMTEEEVYALVDEYTEV